MPFFKYLDPARVDIVEHCRIRFTPAESFNDPFECIPDSRLIEHPAWQKNIEDASVRALLAEDEANARLLNRPRQWTEADIRRIHRERYSVRMPLMKELAQNALRAAREPLRVLCLSAVSPGHEDAFLMWGHYTRNHEGLVIEFDAEHQWFKDHLPKEPEPHDAGAVIYSDRRPDWIVHADGSAEPRREFVFTKSKHWSYEQEYRLIRFPNTPGRDGTSDVDALFPFPPSALISVCFGVNATDETKVRVRAACVRPDLCHVRLRAATTHPDEYRIEIIEA